MAAQKMEPIPAMALYDVRWCQYNCFCGRYSLKQTHLLPALLQISSSTADSCGCGTQTCCRPSGLAEGENCSPASVSRPAPPALNRSRSMFGFFPHSASLTERGPATHYALVHPPAPPLLHF